MWFLSTGASERFLFKTTQELAEYLNLRTSDIYHLEFIEVKELKPVEDDPEATVVLGDTKPFRRFMPEPLGRSGETE